MDKHKESESEVLTRKEMKNTKGGAVPGAIGVSQKPLRVDQTAEPLVEQESTSVSAALRAKR